MVLTQRNFNPFANLIGMRTRSVNKCRGDVENVEISTIGETTFAITAEPLIQVNHVCGYVQTVERKIDGQIGIAINVARNIRDSLSVSVICC